MAYTPVDLKPSGKTFEVGRAAAIRAKDDPNDPASENLMLALSNYFTAMGEADVEIARGLNDILERVDRMETLLKAMKK